ncbi:hypothetical protein [Pseudonocardia nigra]|uniref:hypothetical protein n=1 Tax=Pseudonocardia nigra TaxID=1921578 RepID=UPI003557AEEF
MLDASHVVKLAGNALDEVRRRVQQATLGRRGHRDDPADQDSISRTSRPGPIYEEPFPSPGSPDRTAPLRGRALSRPPSGDRTIPCLGLRRLLDGVEGAAAVREEPLDVSHLIPHTPSTTNIECRSIFA